MSEFSISELSKDQYDEWDKLVFSNRCSSLFHSTVFFTGYGRLFSIYMVRKNEAPILGFITAWEGKPGKRITARPLFSPYLGVVVFADATVPTSFYSNTRKAYELLIGRLKKDFSRISVRLSPFVTDIQAFVWEGFQTRLRYTYLVDISDLTSCFNRFHGNIKRDIRKAEKDNIIVKFDQTLSEHADLFRATRQDPEKNVGLLSRYEASLKTLNICSTIVIENEKGVKLAGVFIVWDRFRAYYLLGGYNKVDEGNQSYTTFALWEAMKYCHEKIGLREFDMEGSMIPGVEFFFRKFGGIKVPYFDILFDKNTGILSKFKKLLKRIV